MATITWKQLVKLEPHLERIRKRALAMKTPKLRPGARFCANDIWYGTASSRGLKAEVERLVGFARKDNAKLSTSDAYDVAVKTIYEALPDCRNCGCS